MIKKMICIVAMLMMCVSISGGCPSRLQQTAEGIAGRTRHGFMNSSLLQQSLQFMESQLIPNVQLSFDGLAGQFCDTNGKTSAKVPVPVLGSKEEWTRQVYKLSEGFEPKPAIYGSIVVEKNANGVERLLEIPPRGQTHVNYGLIILHGVLKTHYADLENITCPSIPTHKAWINGIFPTFEDYEGVGSPCEGTLYLDSSSGIPRNDCSITISVKTRRDLQTILSEGFILVRDLDGVIDPVIIQNAIEDFITAQRQYLTDSIIYTASGQATSTFYHLPQE